MIELIDITSFNAMIPVTILSIFLYGSIAITVARIIYTFFIRPLTSIKI